jgi:MoaA/NifB/PqqE/SkfB family radical SAM enzyme
LVQQLEQESKAMLNTQKIKNVSTYVRTDLRLLGGLVSSALVSPYRPLMVNLVPTRRCNLSCGYCNEYDHTSAPVELSALKERIDHLAKLRAVIVTLTGGEPLLHPQISEVVAYIRERGMTPAMNTNAFLLTAERIQELNDAGLYAMQVSVDAVTPNTTTKKALKPLLPKLRLLAERAIFKVRINTVLGAAPAEEALEVVRTVMSLGLEAKCSLLRNSDGSVTALDEHTREIYQQISKLEGRFTGLFGESFQDALLREGHLEWKCRAGARFFHVCENGLVHLCGPRYGTPATPLEKYTEADIRRAFHQKKDCAATCPVAYAHQASQLDKFRSQQ